MASEEQIRAFLALPLASYFGEEVSPLLDVLRRQFAKIHWVSPKAIHVTLHFFGTIPLREVARISEIVRNKTRRQAGIEVYLEGVGVFPTPSRPHVIWVGLKGEIAKLQSLQRGLEEGLKNVGFPCEERAFRPHLTLGRIKDKAASLNIDLIDFPRTTLKKITELILYQSHLAPDGPRYEVLETYPLSAS